MAPRFVGGLGWVLIGLLFVAAAPPRPEKAEDKEATAASSADLDKLQGTWTSTDDMGQESTWTFAKDKLTLEAPDRSYVILIKLDPEAKPEKHMDFEVQQDSPNAAGYKAPGIYKFDGNDKLKICFGDANTGRPTEYKTDFGVSFSFDLTRKIETDKKPEPEKKPESSKDQ